MKESYNLAKDFYMREWGDEKIKIHSECVIEACLGIIKGTDMNEDVFIIAGWIHDIGRKDDKDSHHKISVTYLDRFLEEHNQYTRLKDEISDCILNHRTQGKPKTLYGAVIKTADKVALKNKIWVKYKESLNA